MDKDNLNKALHVWLAYLPGADIEFEEFVKHKGMVNSIGWGRGDCLTVSEHTYERVQMLLGPNTRTIMQAWLIRHYY